MFRLEDSLGFLVSRAAAAMKRDFEQRLAVHDLTAPQWAVLARLWAEDGQPPSAIGASLFFDRPTITGIVTRLVRKGLVTKRPDPQDGRMTRLMLTATGRRLEKQLPNLARLTNQRALQGLAADEVALLMTALDRVWRNLS